MEETKYVLVKIDLNKLEDYDIGWYKTECKNAFLGKLVNQAYDNFYFELIDGTMVTVPIKWVRWMAPLNNKEEKEKYNVS